MEKNVPLLPQILLLIFGLPIGMVVCIAAMYFVALWGKWFTHFFLEFL